MGDNLSDEMQIHILIFSKSQRQIPSLAQLHSDSRITRHHREEAAVKRVTAATAAECKSC
jgi:hypothetical protein